MILLDSIALALMVFDTFLPVSILYDGFACVIRALLCHFKKFQRSSIVGLGTFSTIPYPFIVLSSVHEKQNSDLFRL